MKRYNTLLYFSLLLIPVCSFSVAAWGQRTIGSGGGFIEMTIFDELNSFGNTANEMIATQKLQPQELRAVTRWQHLHPKVLIEEGKLNYHLVKCENNQIFFNQNELVSESLLSRNLALLAKSLLIRGFSCLTSESDQTMTHLQSIAAEIIRDLTSISQLKDLYQPNLGLGASFFLVEILSLRPPYNIYFCLFTRIFLNYFFSHCCP